MQRARLTDSWFWGLGIGGIATLGNAAWMLADPAGWYAGLPAAVPDTGPLNTHFVRDVGSAFAVFGGAMVGAAVWPASRLALLAPAAAFYVLHALVHVADTLAGRLPATHWAIDFPGVYLPALVMLACTAAVARARPGARRPSSPGAARVAARS